MKILYIFVLTAYLFISQSINAQSFAPLALAIGGSQFYGESFSISATFGQVFYSTLTNTSTLTEGFQQPLLIPNSIVPGKPGLKIEADIYPNPTGNFLFVKLTSTEQFEPHLIEIYDILGRKNEISYTTEKTEKLEIFTLDFNGLHSGHYFVRIIPTGKGERPSTFRVIKQD